MPRTWVADRATIPLEGSAANRKPDLVLVLSNVAKSKQLDWRDINVVGEIKAQKSTKTMNQSYTEVAGKIALLLYAQDGRHTTPCLRVLGHSIVLTFF